MRRVSNSVVPKYVLQWKSSEKCWLVSVHKTCEYYFGECKGKVVPVFNQAPRHCRRIGGVGVYPHSFLTSALDGGEWSALRTGRFTPRERAPGTHSIREPQSRSGRGDEEKNFQPSPGIEPQDTDHPARSLALYRLSWSWSVSVLIGK
jgi:hypothetical protein